MMKRTLAQKKTCASCLRYLLIVTNCLYAIIAGAIIGVFVWMAKEQIYIVNGVLGTNLAMAAVLLLVAAGCVLFFFAFVGIAGAATENPCVLATYMIALVLTFLSFLAAIICIAIFKTWLTEPVRLSMEDNLRNVYGYQVNDSAWNRYVTDSWDAAQKSWQCCAAADKSWAIYQESKWYALQPGAPGSGKPYVPASCCRLDPNGHITNSDMMVCQNTKPPDIGSQYPGTGNPPVNSRGCYETAKDFLLLNEVSWFTAVIGVGVGGLCIVSFGFALAIALCVHVRNDAYSRDQMKMEYMERELSSRDTLQNQYSLNERTTSRTTMPSQYMYSMA